MIPVITIKEATPLVGYFTGKPGRKPKQIAQAIKYSLDNKPESWTAIGVDPATVGRSINDPYTDEIAQAMGWPSVEDVRVDLQLRKTGKKSTRATFPKHTHDLAEDVLKVTEAIGPAVTKMVAASEGKPMEYIPSHPAIIEPAVDPDPKFAPTAKPPRTKNKPAIATTKENEAPSGDKTRRPLAEIIGGRTVQLVALAVVLLADFAACCLNWWTWLDDKPDNIRVASAGIFGLVGIIIGLAGFVNFIKIKDDQTANGFAFIFGAYQLTIHGVLLFAGYSFIGCGAEIIGLVFVPSAILSVIRQDAA